MNDVFIHISTFPFPGDVGRHNHPLLGPSVPAGDPHGITQFLASQQVPTGDLHGLIYGPPISGWEMALIPFCNNPPPMTQYCLLLAPPNQASKEVTYLGTTLAEARLTTEF